MAKQKPKSAPTPVQQAQITLPASTLFYFSDFRTQTILLSLIGLVFYFNSIFNEFALDDGIVIGKNEYVQQGIKGIPKIFSKDAYDSFRSEEHTSELQSLRHL